MSYKYSHVALRASHTSVTKVISIFHVIASPTELTKGPAQIILTVNIKVLVPALYPLRFPTLYPLSNLPLHEE